MRKFGWLVLVMTLVVPALAHAKLGPLDPSFARHGKLVVSAPKPEIDESGLKYKAVPMNMALAPGGKLVRANSRTVEELLANGRRNPNFGRSGVVPITVAAGSRFALAAVAVDSLGRVLVAGTTEPPPGAGEGPAHFPAPPAATGSLYRFLPNGKPDPTFGLGGSMTSSFGQAPPSGPGPGGHYPYATVTGEFPYMTPSVQVTGLAVDSANRPVVLGASTSRITQCDPAGPAAYLTRTFVARLDPIGNPDPGFGLREGVLTDNFVEDPRGFALQSSGKVLYTNPGEEHCPRIPSGDPPTVSFVSPSGQPGHRVPTSANLGSRTQKVLGIAIDRRGRILVLLEKQLWEAGGEPAGILVRRLTPNGAPDLTFGNHGSVSPQLPRRADLTALATDGRGRVLLAGSAPSGRGSAFLVMRLNAAGKVDRTFGRQGRTTTNFPGNARASQVSIDNRGRIVVGGTMTTMRLQSEYGFVFARYRPR
jgi:uncharacterized delta-60 repeat protein